MFMLSYTKFWTKQFSGFIVTVNIGEETDIEMDEDKHNNLTSKQPPDTQETPTAIIKVTLLYISEQHLSVYLFIYL